MTDRELLENAAKAADMDIAFDRPRATGKEPMDWDTGEPWNPLTDDGDALRLAANLEITIMFDHYSVWCEQYGILEKYGGDRLAATRRAIVEAAAKIGRSME